MIIAFVTRRWPSVWKYKKQAESIKWDKKEWDVVSTFLRNKELFLFKTTVATAAGHSYCYEESMMSFLRLRVIACCSCCATRNRIAFHLTLVFCDST